MPSTASNALALASSALSQASSSPAVSPLPEIDVVGVRRRKRDRRRSQVVPPERRPGAAGSSGATASADMANPALHRAGATRNGDLRRNGENRTRSDVQETLRDASEQHSRNASVTSGSDDDQLGIGLLGEIRDEIRGIGVEAVYDVEGCADARLDEVVDLRDELTLQVFLVRNDVRAAWAPAKTLVRMHDEEPPVGLSC